MTSSFANIALRLISRIYDMLKKRKLFAAIVIVSVYFMTSTYRHFITTKKYFRPDNEKICKIPVQPRFFIQSLKDEALYEHFFRYSRTCQGVILEIRAAHDETFSVSKLFEEQLGWQSILVEVNSNNFQVLVKNRSHTEKHYGAICKDESTSFIGSTSDGFIRSSSKKHSNILIPKHLMPCFGLDRILRNYPYINIILLHLEGRELDALETMDWDTTVDYWIIKLNSTRPYRNQAIRDLLQSKGYKQFKWNMTSARMKGNFYASKEIFIRTLKNKNLKVISYSLYGRNKRYIDGAIANAELISKMYPGWQMYIYYDNTVDSNTTEVLKTYYYVKLIDMSKSLIVNKMCWRFLVASDPSVELYAIRDIDSRLSPREKAAVDQWIESGKKFHVMRDHPSHSHYAMSGGMWGGTQDAIPDMKSLLLKQIIQNSYMQDMDFLNNVVWNIAKTSIYQHDSFSCGRYGVDHPFPVKRVDFEHVGSVFIEGKMRESDVVILKNAITSAKNCTHKINIK